MTSSRRHTLRAALAAARWSLRTDWRTFALIAGVAALTLAAALPLAWLVRAGDSWAPRFSLPAVPAWQTSIAWGAVAKTVSATQGDAVSVVFDVLLIEALLLLVVGGLTVLSVAGARTLGHVGEVQVRRAVGASRRALAAGVGVEGLTVAALGVAGGLGLAWAAPLVLPSWPWPLAPGARLPGIGALLAVTWAVLIGSALPLGFASRRHVLRQGDTSLGLPVAALQLGLSLIVLTGAALLARHANLSAGNTGAAARGDGQVLDVAAPAQPSRAFATLLNRLHEGGSAAASLTSPGTLVGLGPVDVAVTECGRCYFHGTYLPLWPVTSTHYLVSPDTFSMLGLHVTAGRGFTSADTLGAPRIAVVSQTLARRAFERGQALGKGISIGSSRGMAGWYTVVGVVDDRTPPGFGGSSQPIDRVYLATLQHDLTVAELLVRDASGQSDPATAVRATLGPAAVLDSRTEQANFDRERTPIIWASPRFATLGWVMLVVAAVGAGAVMVLWVWSVRSQLGVRRAVGATRRRTAGYVLARAGGVGIGGLVIALWLGDLAWAAVADVTPGLPVWDWALLLRLAALLLGVSLLAAAVPAIRAAREAPARLVDG